MEEIDYLCSRIFKAKIRHDRNHCKAFFRVWPNDRYVLRADTVDCYPTRFVGGRRAFGGGS